MPIAPAKPKGKATLKSVYFALNSIKWVQSQERFRCPKLAEEFFKQVDRERIDPNLIRRKQMRELLDLIDDKMEIVRQDVLFAYSFSRRGSWDAQEALKLACALFELKIKAAFPYESARELHIENLKLAIHGEADYETHYGAAKPDTGTVDGMTRLTGIVTKIGSDPVQSVNMFVKFITHPFFQYGRL